MKLFWYAFCDFRVDEVTCIQTIQVGKKYAQSIAISYLPNTTTSVMAVGSTDNKISIYVMQSNQVECLHR